MSQRQVLRARRRADGVGLHEAEPLDGALSVVGEQAAGDREAAEVGKRHDTIMPELKFGPTYHARTEVGLSLAAAVNAQNRNFSASWITRGSPAVVIVPKFAAPTTPFGRAERWRVQQVERFRAQLEG